MLASNGRRDEGIALLDAVAREASPMAWARLAPAMAAALRGERDTLLRVMTPDLRAAVKWDEIFAWWAADCFAMVNERDTAIDFLECAVKFGLINLPWLAEHEPFLANLRGEPRFVGLMERVRKAWGHSRLEYASANATCFQELSTNPHICVVVASSFSPSLAVAWRRHTRFARKEIPSTSGTLLPCANPGARMEYAGDSGPALRQRPLRRPTWPEAIC